MFPYHHRCILFFYDCFPYYPSLTEWRIFVISVIVSDVIIREARYVTSTDGITKPENVAPSYVKGRMVTLGKTKVIKKTTATLINHEKSPNVRRFIGIKSIFKTGATRSIRRLKNIPAVIITCQPPKMTKLGSS